MAEFSFDEFVNTVNNVKAVDETARKQQIVHLVLKAMDELCPNSYMPFLFIHAYTTENAEFVHCKKTDSEVINKQLMVTNDEILNLIKNSQHIANSMIEMMKIANKAKGYTKIDISHATIFINFLSTFKTNADSENCGYWSFKGISKDALHILEQHDTFFKTHFDRALYLALVDILIYYMPENPDNKEHYFYEGFFADMENWIGFFDELIVESYNKRHPNYKTEIPNAFTRIANGLFMDADKAVLYDPFGHLGDFALNVDPHMSEHRELKTPIDFISEQIDDDAICATAIRLLFHDERTLYNYQDVVKDKQGAPTYLATIPPFVSETTVKGEKVEPIGYSLSKGLECAQNGGKTVLIVPSCILVNKEFEQLRKMIVDAAFDIKLVFMPNNSLDYTNIATVIVFIDGTKQCDTIKFVDAYHYVKQHGTQVDVDYISISNLCYHDTDPRLDPGSDGTSEDASFQFGDRFWSEMDDPHHTLGDVFGEGYDPEIPLGAFDHLIKNVLKEEIRQNGYTLNPSYYFDHAIIAPEGYEIRNLSDILIKENEVVDDNAKGKVISARELHKNDSLIEIVPEKITEQKDLTPGGTLIYKIGKGSYILISKVGKLSPTAINVKDEVYVNRNNVCVYKIVDETINPIYLAYQMRESYFVNQLYYANRTSGLLNELDLSVHNIFVPLSTKEKSSLVIQQEKIQEKMLSELNSIDNQYQRLNDQRFNEYIIALRQRKHRLSQILNQVCPAFSLLNKTREKNAGILKDTDVVASRTGENVAQYFGKVHQGLDKIERLIETFVDKNQWGKAEKFALEDFVSEFTQKHICKNYKLQLLLNNISGIDDVDNNENLAKRMVNMPKDELSTVFENIIANAETWGFNDKNRDDYVIRISLGDADNGEHAVVTIANNGTPIHPSVDRKHIFDWGVGNHTGVGTWQAKNIVEHYGGHIRIHEYPDAKDGFKTEYEITLQREY